MQTIQQSVQNRLQEVIRQKEREGFPFKPSNEFYRGIKIHKRRFGQFLRNEKQPTLDELVRIASVLAVSPTDLFKNESPATTANSTGPSQII
ncbi:helix-turn-helix domain-containing protein [Telluribacter sp. SYSU D00476]|uniref:helix-turn-helix domain-containing protein n=1 Tax=Telluribacter sp. SYSU D00476 TaxID=2811430 RepID=UPI0038F68608